MNLFMKYRKVCVDDLSEISILHRSLFKDHYLGKFTLNFIRRFYSCYLTRNIIFLIAESEDNKVVGFVMGGKSSILAECMNQFMRKFFFQYLVEVIVKPSLWLYTLKRILILFRNKIKRDSKLDRTLTWGLLSIGIDKQYQGKGVAKKLLIEFELALPLDISKYILSVKEDNKKAIAFYNKNGFVLKTRKRDGLYLEKEITR